MTSRVLQRSSISSLLARSRQLRGMTSGGSKPVYFGSFEVTDQVFYSTPLCYGLVNLKPLLPGHVLIVPFRKVKRLTELTPDEVSDVFRSVQKVEKMLAYTYFGTGNENEHGEIEDGSFNVALQDGPDAGQSVPHVHCHIIPRLKGNSEGDGIYDRLASEQGNVGGALWDRDMAGKANGEHERPKAGGKFPKIEDSDRKARSKEEMSKEAAFFRSQMKLLELD